MIVKVQISLQSSDGQQHFIVYDEEKKHIFEGPVSKEVLALMKQKKKAFFYAEYINTKIIIGETAPWQNW